MSASNGVIRIGRKGLKKFAIGEDGPVFEVDVVVAFQKWIEIHESFLESNDVNEQTIPLASVPEYHQAAVSYLKELGAGDNVITAEALDFLARLREQYDELADFFQPRSREKPDLPGTSASEMRFSVESTEPN